MSSNASLVWVNKTRESSSLSNSRNEESTFQQIRSQSQRAGHQSSRVKRPIIRTPFGLTWTRTNSAKNTADSIRSQTSRHVDFELPEISLPSSRCRYFSVCRPGDSRLENDESFVRGNALETHRISSIPDPFSAYSVELDPATLDYLWYFQNIWTQCAFKLPGCTGYGEAPIEQFEITAMIQLCLASPLRSQCLLAATSARVQYIHCKKAQGERAHGYAARALYGLRRRMEEEKEFSEEDSTNVLFLAAYEVFCLDETGAGKHLVAVRRLYKQEISNTFVVMRLQANLEILVTKSVAVNWQDAIDHLVQSR